jgi:uncharacterized protein YigA (DUF484 family)
MTDVLDAERVREWLRANPDFVAEPSTLTSFDAFKQRKLGDANVALRTELDQMLSDAKRNQRTVEQSFALALDALEAAPGQPRAQAVVNALTQRFSVDAVRIVLLAPNALQSNDTLEIVDPDSSRGRFIETLHASELPLIGRPSEDRRERLFGADAAQFESFAIARLSATDAQGVLALAARDAERFHPGTGGFLLEPLALLIGRLLRTTG